MIQKQTWKDEIRILITDEENLSSVQIFIPLYVSDLFGKAAAFYFGQDFLVHYPSENMVVVGNEFDI